MNCDDALLLEKIPSEAKEQHLAVSIMRKALKVRDDDVFINARSEDELAGYFTYELAPCPPTHFDDCCSRERNIFSNCHSARRLGTKSPSSTIYSSAHD